MEEIVLAGEDEYLTIMQAAYILKMQRRGIEYRISLYGLNADKAGNKRLIKRSDLYNLVSNKLSKFSEVYKYIECTDKVEYWRNYPDLCNKFNDDVSMLTQNQVAHLLDITPRAVSKKISEGTLEVVYEKGRKYVPIQYLLKYIERATEKYDLACEYFMQDPEEFWKNHYEKMLTTTVEEERKRKKAAHERKVQKKAGRTDNCRRKGDSGTKGT